MAADGIFPFRRMTDPLMVPVTPSPTAANALAVPGGYIPIGTTSFLVVNSNLCWVRLLGTSATQANPNPTQPNVVAEGRGWLFSPGFFGIFSTQNPLFMSAMAVERDGYPLAGLNFVPLELSYGGGA